MLENKYHLLSSSIRETIENEIKVFEKKYKIHVLCGAIINSCGKGLNSAVSDLDFKFIFINLDMGLCRQSFVYDILKLNGEKYTYLEMKGTNLDVILAENRDYHLIRPTIPSYSFTSNGRIMTSHLDLNLVMSSSMRWNEPFFITNEQKIQELFNITRYVDTSYSVSMQRLNAIKCCDRANVRQYLYLFQDVLGLEYAIKEEKFPPLSFEFLYAHDMISDINIKEKIRFLLVENQRRPDIDTKIKDEKFTRSKDYVFTTRDSYLESNLEERLQKCVEWLEKFNCYQES